MVYPTNKGVDKIVQARWFTVLSIFYLKDWKGWWLSYFRISIWVN